MATGIGESGPLERDFRRFRDAGDPEALARVFDAAAPRLLVLAQHLTRDAGRAEDLVQAVFVAAIEDAPRWDGARPVMPWLSAILAHRAQDLRRRERLRAGAADASDAPDDGALDPGELASGRELAARAAGAIEAMPDADRRVLVLRLVHGLTPTEIAHALGDSPGAVRMRLKRGRDRLRAALPALSASLALLLGERGRGLGPARQAVLERAAELVAGTATAGGGAALAGALTMKTTILAGGAVAVAAALWWARPDETEPVAPEAARPGAVATEDPRAPSGAARPGAVAVPEAARERVVAPAGGPARSAVLAVRVRRAEDGTPAADVGVYARPADGGFGIEVRTDVDGEASLADLAPGSWTVDLDRWDRPAAAVRLAPGERRALELALPDGVDVDGRVVDLEARPVPGAAVYRVRGRHHDFLQLVAVADAGGRFRLEDAARSTRLVARADGHQPSEPTWVAGADDAGALALVMGARGQRVSGVVVDPDGTPVARALVAFGVDEDAREEPDGLPRGRESDRGRSKAPDLEAFFVRADPAGRFESREVPAGPVRLLARPPEEGGPSPLVAWTTVDVAPGTAHAVTLRLAAGASISGRLADEEGAPLGGLVVEAEWEGTDELGQTEDDLGPWIADRQTTSAYDGTYALVGLLPGDHDLRVFVPADGDPDELFADGEALHRDEAELEPGEAAQWSPTLAARATLALVVLDPHGEPLSGWGVGTSDRPGELRARDLVADATDAHGRYRVPGLERRAWQVSVHAPDGDGGVTRLPAAVRTGLVPGPEEVAIRLRPDEMPTARLVARVVDRAGRPVRDGLYLERRGWRETQVVAPHARADDEGVLRLAPLAAGAYRLLYRPDGVAWRAPLGDFDLGTGERRDAGTVVVPEPAELTIEVRADDGGDVRGARVRVHGTRPGDPADAVTLDGRLDDEGHARFRLWAGEYRVTASGDDVAGGSVAVVLDEGGRETRAVVCPRGREQEFVVAVPPDPGGRAVGRVHFRIEGAGGRVVVDERESAPYDAQGRMRFVLRLAPGRYVGRFENHPVGIAFAGEATAADFTVPAAGGGAVRIDVPARR